MYYDRFYDYIGQHFVFFKFLNSMNLSPFESYGQKKRNKKQFARFVQFGFFSLFRALLWFLLLHLLWLFTFRPIMNQIVWFTRFLFCTHWKDEIETITIFHSQYKRRCYGIVNFVHIDCHVRLEPLARFWSFSHPNRLFRPLLSTNAKLKADFEFIVV